MSEGNGTNSSTYQILDRKIDNVEREIRSELSGLRAEFADLGNRIADKIDRSNKQTNPYQLIGTALLIVGALGGAGSYVSANISSTMMSISTTLSQEVRDREHDREQYERDRDDDHKQDNVRLDQERRDRDEDRKRIYAYVNDEAWPRAAHLEFEKRMDERRDAEREQVSAITHTIEVLSEKVVPRDENEQRWKDGQTSLAQLAATLTASISRVQAHLDNSDAVTAAKMTEIEHVIHGFGLADEVKQIEAHQQATDDKVFNLLGPASTTHTPAPSPH